VAFKTFTDGVPLPEGDLNDYLMRQCVITTTSGARPSSPTEGMTIYETDTDRLLIYTTATTGWVGATGAAGVGGTGAAGRGASVSSGENRKWACAAPQNATAADSRACFDVAPLPSAT
jgi:hypothetical protein